MSEANTSTTTETAPPSSSTTTETTTTAEPTNGAQTDATSSSNTDTGEGDQTVDLGTTTETTKEGGETTTETTETDEGGEELTDEQKAEQEAEAERAKLFGAPEGDTGYEIAGLPEGMEVDTEALAAVTPIFKQLGLSNEGASLIAKAYAEQVLPKVGEAALGQLQSQITEQRTNWETETRDAIAGKIELKNAKGEALTFDGKKLEEVRTVAAKALDKLAPAGFRDFLAESGLGVHPAMMAMAYMAGKSIKEDTEFEPSGRDAGGAERREDKYYKSK